MEQYKVHFATSSTAGCSIVRFADWQNEVTLDRWHTRLDTDIVAWAYRRIAPR